MLKRAVYVWQLPIRVWHWLNAIFIAVLLFTGLYIGNPPFSLSGEAYSTFLMGKVRIIHNVAAWAFIAGFILRGYWWFAGNKYSRYNPLKASYWAKVWETMKYYFFLKRKVEPHAGHNALAQLGYFTVIAFGGSCMIVSGLALQAETLPDSLRGKLFGWVIPLIGSSFALRSIHHLIAWTFLPFVIFHLYFGIRQEFLWRDSTISSIINGYKYLSPEAAEYADD